jgi:hypothetical protein
MRFVSCERHAWRKKKHRRARSATDGDQHAAANYPMQRAP